MSSLASNCSQWYRNVHAQPLWCYTINTFPMCYMKAALRPGTHWIGDCVGPSVGLETVQKI